MAEVSINATIPGTYTLTIDDGSAGGTGTGSYRLKWIKPGSPIVTATGDEGGALINGGMHIGVIPVGDFDAWTFSAASGDNIVVRIGETTPGSSLSPLLKLYGPDGSLLGFASSAEAAEVAVRTTNNGLFTVVAGDGSAGFTGSGNYRLSLGKTGSTIVISPADEGGSMSGIASYSGTIDVGDLDIWTFSACAGDSLQIQMSELTPGAALSPWLRLYGRDGLLLDSVSNAAIAQISRLAPAAGTYTVIAGDGSPGLGGSGAYTLSVNALSSGLKFCSPNLFGTNLNLRGVGGVSNATFVLLQSTNAGSAIGLWSPMLTNQFDGFGAFTLTNFINPATHQQFFRLAEPQ